MSDHKPCPPNAENVAPPKPGVRLKSRRGPIGQTWWARCFVNLIPLHTPADAARARLGRSIAGGGRVLTLEIGPGRVRAEIRQGAKPELNTGLRLAILSDEIWKRAVAFLEEKAHFSAKLLAGELPENIEEAFADSRGLIPENLTELRPFCSCGAGKTPCEHVLAVLYLLAERLDDDPFTLFLVRGRSREDLLEALRRKRQVVGSPSAPEVETPRWNWPADERPPATLPLPADPALFWGRPPTAISIPGSERPFVPLSVLQRIGLPPFTPAPQALWHDLTQAYPSREQARPDI